MALHFCRFDPCCYLSFDTFARSPVETKPDYFNFAKFSHLFYIKLNVTNMMSNSSSTLNTMYQLLIILLQLNLLGRTNAFGSFIQRTKEQLHSLSPATNEEYLLSSTDDWDFQTTFEDETETIAPSVSQTSRPQVDDDDNSTIYSVDILSAPNSPILSWVDHTAIYQQVYNPCWISQGDALNHSGLVVLVQNCSLDVECTFCLFHSANHHESNSKSIQSDSIRPAN